MDRHEIIQEARDCLAELTPLKGDCGRYCGCACCEADESGENGMLLLPGEEAFYTQNSPEFPFRLIRDDTLISGGLRLVCEGRCIREQRPFACRIFPLRLRIGQDGCKAEIDPRAYVLCPLPERGGLRGLDRAFVNAAEQAGKVLLEDKTIRGALLREQELLDRERYL